MLFDSKEKIFYDVVGSYKVVKNHNDPLKQEETTFQSFLTTLPR